MSVVAQADHVIDMGPAGGDEGGQVVASGTPTRSRQRREPDRSVPAGGTGELTDGRRVTSPPRASRGHSAPFRKDRCEAKESTDMQLGPSYWMLEALPQLLERSWSTT